MDKKLMSKFSDWLKHNRKKSGMTLIQLKSAIGDLCSDAYLSKLENDRYKGKKGLPNRPDKEIVLALADVFKENPDKVLILAGYLPENEPTAYPQTEAEFTEALKQFGVCGWKIPEEDMDKTVHKNI